MENASKALLMAAGMLIAVMIASLFALLFSTMSSYTEDYETRKKTEEMQAFNAQFQKYETSGATAQDIVTVINLAKSYNEEMENPDALTVEVKMTSINQNTNEPDLNDFLMNNSEGYDTDGKLKIIKYSIERLGYENGQVNEIEFKQNGFFD